MRCLIAACKQTENRDILKVFRLLRDEMDIPAADMYLPALKTLSSALDKAYHKYEGDATSKFG